MKITKHLFKNTDAIAVSELIARTLRITNSRDYSTEYIERDIARLDPEFLINKAQQTHFYVFCDQSKIIGTGAIGPFWDSKTDFSFFTIFVDPTYQGNGIGRLIIETLEQDDYFKQAQRVEIPASITALKFYQKMGYTLKNQQVVPDIEQLFRLEKFPKKEKNDTEQ